MSHELRTPLTGIIGLHELLDRGGRLDERQREYLKLARLSAGNLLTLIDDLLDFSKIEAGHIEVERVDFDLVDCVEEPVNGLAARAHFKGLELLVDIAPDVPIRLLGDPHRIKQVLLNLVGNAIKFTEQGNIRVRVIKMANNSADSSDGDDTVRLRFEIHDNGIGIPHQKRQLIFEAFRQADSSTTRRFGGTGLGLTICRDLVNKMGGVIGVSDASDLQGNTVQGSCFFFELELGVKQPFQAREVNYKPTSEEIVVAAAPSMWRELLCREIVEMGYEVSTYSVQELIENKQERLFAAGNHTVVFADFSEIVSEKKSSFPVVTRWVLLTPLGTEHANAMPNWLQYADVSWLSRPVRQEELRRAIQAIEPTPVGDNAAIALGRSADVLLVEDSPISQRVLRDMLEGLGHHVRLAGNGKEAIAACNEKLFDLVLMDIQMPDIDGLEATRQIRAAESGLGRSQKIYALTAHATGADRSQCEAVGMEGFLVKPIALDVLGAAVQQALYGEAERSIPEEEAPGGPSNSGNGEEVGVMADQAESTRAESGDGRYSVQRALEDAQSWDSLVVHLHRNEDLLRDVLTLLVSEAPRLGRVFKDSLARREFKEVRRAAHTLKSNARHLQLNRIAAFAEQLENSARDEQAEVLDRHCESVLETSSLMAEWAHQLLDEHAV